jgi:O-antigen ligase
LASAALAALGLLGFSLAVIPAPTQQHLATVFAGPTDSSGHYRIDVAQATLRLIGEHPLVGSGLGAYADALPSHKQGHGDIRVTHAESDVLEYAAEGGLVGLALAGWLGVLVLRGFGDRVRGERDPFRKGIAMGAMAAVGALLVHSLFDFNLRIPSNALVFASLLGLAAAPRKEARRIGGRWTSGVGAGVLFLLALAAAWRSYGAWELEHALSVTRTGLRIEALDGVLGRHPYLAEGYRARGLAWRDLAHRTQGYETSRLARARRDLERAIAIRPQWGEAWADLGWTRFLGGNVSGADEALKRAAEFDPTHRSIGMARAEFMARTEGEASAVGELRRLLDADRSWSVAQARAAARRWTADEALLDELRR